MYRRTLWIKKNLIGSVSTILGGIIGGIAVWASLFFIFYFDTWTARLISISLMFAFIYLIAKILDRIKNK